MPNKQLYGKRSRAVYDPLAIFESPHGSGRKDISSDGRILESGKYLTCINTSGTDTTIPHGRIGGQKVLREKSHNVVVKPPSQSEIVEKSSSPRAISDAKDLEKICLCRHGRNANSKASSLIGRGKKETEHGVAPRRREHRSRLREGPSEIVSKASATTPTKTSCQPALSPPRKAEPDESKFGQDGGATQKLFNVANASFSTNHFNVHCAPLLELSSHAITPFEDWSSELSNHFTVTKIAEASFGEVYRLSLKQDLPFLSLTKGEESVLKIIALTPPQSTLPTAKRARNAALRRAEAMSAPTDVASEVRLLQRMASTPGFTNFRDLQILQGKPSKIFAEAYASFNAAQRVKGKETSIFPDPAKKTAYREEQLWAVIEMQDAGTDLERLVEDGQFADIWHIWDAFWQVVLALAKGEEEAEYEHRDLHLGNICVRQSADIKSARNNQHKPARRTVDTKKKLAFTDTEVTLIDYTISRCRMSPPMADADGPVASDIAYTDLSHPSQESLFNGDSTSEYQYEIYRYMRSMLHFSDPLAPFNLHPNRKRSKVDSKSQSRSWAKFSPATNLIWLHYVLYKLLEQIDWPSARGVKTNLEQRQSGRERKEWKRACELESALIRVRDVLGLEAFGRIANGEAPLASAGELVAFAVAEGWLDIEDVVGHDSDEGDELLARQIQSMALEDRSGVTGLYVVL